VSTISELREQRRADRAADAQQRRQDAAAAAEEKRRDQREQQRLKAERRAARAGRLKTAGTWIAGHPVELLMSLIIVVPALLAWSAMSAYGIEVYGGGIGWALPAFTEGGMWAFAFAAHAARRDNKPVGWLLTGVWVFTAVAAAMNFTHGAEVSTAHGLVMATVATGGVVAHQLITAAPMRTRRTPAERRAARTARIAARRVTAMERKAVRQAAGEVSGDGSVHLVYRPGTVALQRGWTGRTLVPATVPGRPVTPVADEFDAELAALLGEASEPVGTAETASDESGEGTAEVARELAVQVRRAIQAGELSAKPSRRKVQALLGVRASTAQDVIRVLRGDDGGATEAVAA